MLKIECINQKRREMNKLINVKTAAVAHKIRSAFSLFITLLVLSIAFVQSAHAKFVDDLDPRILGDCAVQVFSYYEDTPNPPDLDQTGHYCNCLFSYDEKTEKPFTMDTITDEHIDQCKAKYLENRSKPQE